MSLRWIAAVFALLGAALMAIGANTGPAGFGIEGAYFIRAGGTPAFKGASNSWSSGAALFSLEDGNLYLGGGIVLLAIAAGALLAHRAGLRIVRRD